MTLKESVDLLTDEEIDRANLALKLIEDRLTKVYGKQNHLANWVVVALERLLADVWERTR